MSEQNSEPQPEVNTPNFILSNLFNQDDDSNRNRFNNTSEMIASGLGITPLPNIKVESIYSETLIETVKHRISLLSNNTLHIPLDKRLFFNKICDRIDHEMVIGSQQEFFYAVSLAVELLKRADQLNIPGYDLQKPNTHITDMLEEVLRKPLFPGIKNCPPSRPR